MRLNKSSRARGDRRLGVALLFLAAAWTIGTSIPAQADAKIKVGFIYPGTIDDHNWNTNQEEGRKSLEKKLPWVETSYVESVAEDDLESYIDQMAEQGVKVIFTASAGYVDSTVAAAARHPDVIFFNVDGYKQAANLGTFDGDTYQCLYLMGMAAGGLTKTGKVGTVAPYPTPDAVRLMDAFVLGLRAVNPQATLQVQWLNSWYDPPAATEASGTLLEQGCDVLMNGTNSSTVMQVAEAHHVPSCGMGSDGPEIAPTSFITGFVWDWTDVYPALLQQVRDGAITPHNLQNFDEWLRLGSHAVKIFYKPGVLFNPRYQGILRARQVDDGAGHQVSLSALIEKRYEQMSVDPPQFEPFTGPLVDADGKLRIAAGQTAGHAQLFSLTWRLPGISGNWPTP